MATPALVEWLTGIAALSSGVLGTQGVHWYIKKRNGGGETERIVSAVRSVESAIRTENSTTRQVLHQHHESMGEVVRSFEKLLGQMRQDCALSHLGIAKDVERLFNSRTKKDDGG